MCDTCGIDFIRGLGNQPQESSSNRYHRKVYRRFQKEPNRSIRQLILFGNCTLGSTLELSSSVSSSSEHEGDRSCVGFKKNSYSSVEHFTPESERKWTLYFEINSNSCTTNRQPNCHYTHSDCEKNDLMANQKADQVFTEDGSICDGMENTPEDQTTIKLTRVVIGRGQKDEYPELNTVRLVNEHLVNRQNCMWRVTIMDLLKQRNQVENDQFSNFPTVNSCLYCFNAKNVLIMNNRHQQVT